MASEDSGNETIFIRSDFRISRPVPQESFPLAWTDWEFIKEMVHRCRVSLDFWAIATSFCFGLVTVALSVALSSDANSISARWLDLYWGVSVGGAIVGVVCLAARLALRNTQHRSVRNVLEQMEHVERRFRDYTGEPR